MASEQVMPCAVLVDGPLGEGVLIPGVAYRVTKVREHWEPSPNEGESPHISTVIRFEPAEAIAAREADLAVAVERLPSERIEDDGNIGRHAYGRSITPRSESGYIEVVGRAAVLRLIRGEAGTE